MSQSEISCGLDYSAVSDAQDCLTEALRCNYSFVVLPIVNPRFRRHYTLGKGEIGGFTRSDMVMSPQDWTVRIVGRVSPYLDVDAPSPVARQRHESCLTEELSYCRGLGLPAIIIKLHSQESENLARILQSYYEASYHFPLVWLQVPMMCNRTLKHSDNENIEEQINEAYEEPWRWWSLFHERMCWNKRVGVVLELPADIPPEDVIMRWLGEPVKAVVIPTSIFFNNKKGYPVLSTQHQKLVTSLVEHESQVIVSGARRSDIEFYVQYLYRLWQRRPHQADDPMLSYAKGWEDYLQIPLQPLADNLDTHTYNVFEKDPVKYNQYQRAISKALLHLKQKNKNDKGDEDRPSDVPELGQGDADKVLSQKKVIVMVLGAGRGPLVRATLNAADLTKSRVKVYAVEKNPCAVVALQAQVREVWRDRDVIVVAGDMRRVNMPEKADIIVSELLGSWSDNELSPECLDGAAGLLKPDGISIPRTYTSYVAPISSPRLWAAANTAAPAPTHHKDKNMETLWVVYMQNKHDIAATKPVFTFEHPAKGTTDNEGEEVLDYRSLPLVDNRRSATLSWEVVQDNVMYGFGGYFDCTLFGDEMLSIVPSTHSPGMISWFPVFIPIKTPLRVHKGDTITATFWRCVDSRRVWYEWVARVGTYTTPIHNTNGRSSEMLFVEASDGSIFPPSLLDRKRVLKVFFPNLCRRLPFHYEKDVETEDGISLLRYRFPENIFDDPSRNPSNQCYCEIDSGTCPPRGVINVTSCAMGAPALVSFPHFHLGDPKLREDILGLHPDPSQHDSFLDIHPKLGIALNGKSSFQINIQVRKTHMFTALEFLPQDLIMPIAWLEVSVEELPESLQSLIYHGTYSTAAAQLALIIASATALVISSLCLVFLIYRRRREPCVTLKKVSMRLEVKK